MLWNRTAFWPMTLVMVILSGCTYKAAVLEAPSFAVQSSFGTKIDGLWLLYVEAANLDRPTQTDNFACSAHKFPIEMARAFATSTQETLSNVVERIQVVPGPVDNDGLRAQGARGIIIVRGNEVRPHLEVKPGFWSASMSSSATVIATVEVNSLKGRLLGQTVEGQGFGNNDAGGACEGGGKALAAAAGQGMNDVMRKIGEAISNSERVRGG